MVEDQILGVSLDEPLTEIEFLSRELHISWTTISEKELVAYSEKCKQKGRKFLWIVSDVSKAKAILHKIHPNSAVLLLLSDEGANQEGLSLAKSNVFTAVYRNYSVDLTSFRSYVSSCFQAFFDSVFYGAFGTRLGGTLGWARACISGFSRRKNISGWKVIRSKIHYLPLGYTQKFADSFLHYLNQKNYSGSLYEIVTPSAEEQREVFISFSGSLGAWQRRVGLQRLAKIDGSSVFVKNGTWLGHATELGEVDLRYCEELFSSKFSFCPPGYLSNESYRFDEALICGAMPIQISQSITQGCVGIFQYETVFSSKSFRALFSKAKSVDHVELKDKVSEMLVNASQVLNIKRNEILKSLE